MKNAGAGPAFVRWQKRMKDYFAFFSSETVSFLRPRLRRAASTRRPLAVSMRLRKPCLFFLRRFDGWKVRFMMKSRFLS